MRPLFELVTIGAIILAGWNRPFRDHVNTLLPWAEVAPSRFAEPELPGATPEVPPPQPKPEKRDNSWMWAPTKLDRKNQH